MIIPVVEIYNRLDPNGVEQLGSLAIFSRANFKEILLPMALGVGTFVIWRFLKNRGKTYYPSYLRLPRLISLDYWYTKGAQDIKSAGFLIEKVYAMVRLVAINIFKMGFISAYFLEQIFHWTSFDYWYTQSRRSSTSRGFLIDKIHGIAKLVVITVIRYVNQTSEKLTPLVKEYSGDIALGALVITVCLLLLLVIALL
jgi:hypothetical protein